MGDNEGAYETLASVVDEFVEHADLLYDLACYACLSGEYGDAKHFLEKAIANADEKLKVKALNDAKLAELWQRIGTI